MYISKIVILFICEMGIRPVSKVGYEDELCYINVWYSVWHMLSADSNSFYYSSSSFI